MGAVPELISLGAINKTLRCAVENKGKLLPILGGQSLGETPSSSNVETANFFLFSEEYPGDDTPGQFQFGWRLMPGNPIDQMLIDAGRKRTDISLDFRNPGSQILGDYASGVVASIAITAASGGAKTLSEVTIAGLSVDIDDDGEFERTTRIVNAADNDAMYVGSVIELKVKPTAAADDLFPIAAIMTNSSGASGKIYTRGVGAAAKVLSALARPGSQAYSGFQIRDPSVVYKVKGTGLSFTTDSSGPVAIGTLTMTVDTEPKYELIRHDQVDLAYQYN